MKLCCITGIVKCRPTAIADKNLSDVTQADRIRKQSSQTELLDRRLKSTPVQFQRTAKVMLTVSHLTVWTHQSKLLTWKFCCGVIPFESLIRFPAAKTQSHSSNSLMIYCILLFEFGLHLSSLIHVGWEVGVCTAAMRYHLSIKWDDLYSEVFPRSCGFSDCFASGAAFWGDCLFSNRCY